NVHLTFCAVRGAGVKQSGNRMFQLNNLQRKIVDELFYEWSMNGRVLSPLPKLSLIGVYS
ncbi:hypothetical protein ACJBSF_12045, partial [Streptococcus suis]